MCSFVCSNDAYDAETGVDKDKKESVVNMTGRYAQYVRCINSAQSPAEFWPFDTLWLIVRRARLQLMSFHLELIEALFNHLSWCGVLYQM